MADEKTTDAADTPTTDQPATGPEAEEENDGGKWYFWPLLIPAILVGIFVVAFIVALVIALFGDADGTATWIGMFRDFFIILLAMEGLFIGIAVIVLVLQLAALINLLQNEVGPIVDNANETVTTVRGTAQFMSQNVIEPVVRASAYTAGIGAILRELLGIRRALKSGQRNGKSTPTSEE